MALADRISPWDADGPAVTLARVWTWHAGLWPVVAVPISPDAV
jgi:hypothetical protein